MPTFFPEPEALRSLAGLPDDAPVVMLNLLRFAPGGGARAYRRYAEAFLEILAGIGGRVLYRGRAERLVVGQGEWHQVMLIEYPSRRAFVEMFDSQAYRAIHPYRDEGLADTVLYALRTEEHRGPREAAG